MGGCGARCEVPAAPGTAGLLCDRSAPWSHPRRPGRRRGTGLCQAGACSLALPSIVPLLLMPAPEPLLEGCWVPVAALGFLSTGPGQMKFTGEGTAKGEMLQPLSFPQKPDPSAMGSPGQGSALSPSETGPPIFSRWMRKYQTNKRRSSPCEQKETPERGRNPVPECARLSQMPPSGAAARPWTEPGPQNPESARCTMPSKHNGAAGLVSCVQLKINKYINDHAAFVSLIPPTAPEACVGLGAASGACGGCLGHCREQSQGL